MRKSVLVILLTFIMLVYLQSQNSRRDWADGKLTWNDFIEKKIRN